MEEGLHNSSCGASNATADQALFTRLTQFLMGLSETFDHLRDQLLVMDPVPTVKKAYSMILRVEKQREVSIEGVETLENLAMHMKVGGRKEHTSRQWQHRTHTDKRNMYCNNCDRPGHSRDTCFKLHGTPDWY
ncbi:UNVERIFIED_CONTAM: hypothetical protein Sindi_0849900 [Sesamum indicum]